MDGRHQLQRQPVHPRNLGPGAARRAAGRRWLADGRALAPWLTGCVTAGAPANARPEAHGDVRGDIFACPDGAHGVLWIQTDMASNEMHRGEMQGFGNNQMLACDPATGEVRRFLTGPVGCEITGIGLTPDGRTMFVNIQRAKRVSFAFFLLRNAVRC
ncbi:alkaline phosphatase PhoX [Propionivibrio sp.]|uniref:alkaline phosphatase PhoX n=1 Tax=Propionivibrio sp. TaxID=2212460 RepID=UPI003BF30F30